MSTLTVDCLDESFERLWCNCGDWSRLSIDQVKVTVGDVRISGSVPTLICDACGLRRIPPGSKWAMCDLAAEATRRGTRAVEVDIVNARGISLDNPGQPMLLRSCVGNRSGIRFGDLFWRICHVF
jgi:hypothetical protein